MKATGVTALLWALLVFNSSTGLAGQPRIKSADSGAASESQTHVRTVWVPPPTGSLLGGGYFPVPAEVSGEGEEALLAAIRQLNATAGRKQDRPYVVTAIARSTGVSAEELQMQQQLFGMQFGDLCAVNAIAQGKRPVAQRIAALKSHQSWTEIARSYGLTISHLIQTARSAGEITALSSNRQSARIANTRSLRGEPNGASRSGVEPVSGWVNPNHASTRLLPYARTNADVRERQPQSKRMLKY